MKKTIILLTLLVGLNSCSKYLDIIPDNVATIDYAFTMRNTAERYLFTCYSYMPEAGNLTTDPAFLGSGDLWALYQVTISGAQYARGEQSVVNPLLNYWDGLQDGSPLFKGIRDCNIFLENVFNVPDMQQAEKERWAAEATFLKAYYHFYLLRMYGPIPLIDKNLPIDAGLEKVRVSREPVDVGFQYIVKLLDEAIEQLPPTITDEGSELGRITKPIAMAVKALVLVEAASPIFNGNADYPNFVTADGTPMFNPNFDAQKWKLAADACKEAIDMCHQVGMELYTFTEGLGSNISDTTRIQMNIRNAITEKWNSEIIWANTKSNASQTTLTPRTWDPDRNHAGMQGRYAPPLNLVNLYYTDNGVPIDEDKDWDYNGRFNLKVAEEEDRYNIKEGYTTVSMHFDRENRFYAGIGFDGGIWYGQGKFDDNDTWFIAGKAGQPASRQISTHYSPTGYWAKKLINYQNVIGTSSYSVVGYSWPNMRLADLYLLYAEALNEYQGPSDDVFEFLDLVRERAGLLSVKESWGRFSKSPGKFKTKEGLREIIHRERQIELAMEGKRLWDLLRWKTAHVELNRAITGWDLAQAEAELYYRETLVFQPEFKKRDYFWPIREYNIVRNRNLVQNPGW